MDLQELLGREVDLVVEGTYAAEGRHHRVFQQRDNNHK
jgi:hypothetical protein